jgi:molybdenum cofactor guanylyltransferase
MAHFMADADNIPAVILAGGLSRRMGRNKALVEIGGKSMLARVAERIAAQSPHVALNAEQDWPETSGLRLVPDTVSGKAGPLAGILAAMLDTAGRHQTATHVATVPVDSPFFPHDLLQRLASALEGPDEIAIAASGSRDHPVFGLWPVSASDDLQEWLDAAEHRRVHDFLMRHAVTEVHFPLQQTAVGEFDPFFNINTPDDVLEAERWLEVLAS